LDRRNTRRHTRQFFKVTVAGFLKVSLQPSLHLLKVFYVLVDFPELAVVFVELAVLLFNAFKFLFRVIVFYFFGGDVGCGVFDTAFEFVEVLFLAGQTEETFLFCFEVCNSLFAKVFDVVQGFGVPIIGVSAVSWKFWWSLPCSFEDVVEFLFENGRLGERPVRVFLVAEDDVFEYGL
jgi:hypothetical protein